MSKAITVSDEFNDMISMVQKKRGIEERVEAVDYIGKVFASRFRALAHYAEKKAGGKPARAPKAKAKAKAKGPIARKAKAA